MLRGLRGYALHAITRESSRYTDPRLGAECPRDTGCRHAGRIKRYRLPRLFPLLAPQTCIPCPGSPCGVYPRKAHAGLERLSYTLEPSEGKGSRASPP